ncbi:MAG TPA: RagB/SusD family nutrient uptake outer membrane protein [Prolixibacteraceae bacterium]|nr:RagB/SusD family nutrient uptake outer membrane protein [Prolixibacteraceae bacterium]
MKMEVLLNERVRELYWKELRHVELARISYLYQIICKSASNGTYTKANFKESNFFYDRVIKKNSFYKYNIPNKGPDGGDGDKYTIRAYHIYWPIPFETVEANRLGHINQTPGYHGAETNITPKDYPEDYN